MQLGKQVDLISCQYIETRGQVHSQTPCWLYLVQPTRSLGGLSALQISLLDLCCAIWSQQNAQWQRQRLSRWTTDSARPLANACKECGEGWMLAVASKGWQHGVVTSWQWHSNWVLARSRWSMWFACKQATRISSMVASSDNWVGVAQGGSACRERSWPCWESAAHCALASELPVCQTQHVRFAIYYIYSLCINLAYSAKIN